MTDQGTPGYAVPGCPYWLFCAVFILDSSELKAGTEKQGKVYGGFPVTLTKCAPGSEGLLAEWELFVKCP